MSTPQQRPGQATLAMGLILGGSVLVIATAWQSISGLHTIEVQQQLAKVVAQQSLSGLTVSSLMTILRVLCLIGGGAAAATAVLAPQVLKRSRSARVALTALAPLLLLGWLGTHGFYEPFVLTGIVLLWLPPTNDWYVGRDPSARAHAMTPPTPPAPAPPAPPAPSVQWTQPAPPHAQPPSTGWPPPQPSAAPQPWVASPYPPLARRPASLVRACVMTWVACPLSAIGIVVAMVWLTRSGESFVHDVVTQSQQVWGSMATDVTESQVRAELYVILAGFLLWCFAAMLLAVFAWFGQAWARVMLAVSAIGAGGCALIGTLAFPPLLVVAACCAVAAFQLLRRDAASWHRH